MSSRPLSGAHRSGCEPADCFTAPDAGDITHMGPERTADASAEPEGHVGTVGARLCENLPDPQGWGRGVSLRVTSQQLGAPGWMVDVDVCAELTPGATFELAQPLPAPASAAMREGGAW